MQKDEPLEQALIDDLITRIERETGIDIRKQHVTDKVALDLMDWLSQTADDPDWSQIAHQFVNQETSFFRSHSVLLALENLLDRNIKHIWFAGCSTGEEAYSLLLLASLKNIHPIPSIIATDLSRRSIECALTGHYPIHRKSEKLAVETFLGTGLFEMSADDVSSQAVIQLNEKARNQIEFFSQNLLKETFREVFDLIVCRNVLVHMSDAGQAIVLDRLVEALIPGGVLILGDSDPRPSNLKPLEIGGLLLWSKIPSV